MATRFHLTLNRMHAMDTALCLRVNRFSRYGLVLHLFRAVSRLGDGVFWYVLMLGLLLTQAEGSDFAVMQMLLAGGSGTLIYKAIKGKTLRPRPFEVHQHIALGIAPLDKFSFPSGHTLHAVAFTLVAVAHFPALAWGLVPFACLVGASRVVLGLHYPSDVLAGALIGFGVGWSVLQLF